MNMLETIRELQLSVRDSFEIISGMLPCTEINGTKYRSMFYTKITPYDTVMYVVALGQFS